jgi:LuxR family maltose regulon positive regulatory protein
LARLLTAAEAGEWTDSVIEILLLQALAHQACGDIPQALPTLERALLLAEPEGYVRLFVDEGAPMRQLLSAASARGTITDYTAKLLAAFIAEQPINVGKSYPPAAPAAQPLIDPLSQRELEVLHLIAQGFSNQEIGARLFLAVDTVKGHNRRIFDKLQVQRRTEAVAKARSLNLLSSH